MKETLIGCTVGAGLLALLTMEPALIFAAVAFAGITALYVSREKPDSQETD